MKYRGYDSWGIAYKQPATSSFTQLEKSEAQIALGELEDARANRHRPLTLATHGGVTENAHPHFSEHRDRRPRSGIFENYAELKEEALEKGHTFTSETDSEVLVHLIEDEMED